MGNGRGNLPALQRHDGGHACPGCRCGDNVGSGQRENVIFDCIKTEDLPLATNGQPSRYMRIVATDAENDIFSVVMFSTDADYLGGGGDWGNVDAEQI